MDNFYNDIPLAANLLSKKHTSLVPTGVIKNIYQGNSQRLNSTQWKCVPGAFSGRHNGWTVEGQTLCLLYFNRNIMTKNIMTTITNKHGEPMEKPLPIVKYNANMKGVVRLDQMMALANARR